MREIPLGWGRRGEEAKGRKYECKPKAVVEAEEQVGAAAAAAGETKFELGTQSERFAVESPPSCFDLTHRKDEEKEEDDE
ncbi:hypothetical protein RUM43_010498 [Polyplax serrata]|uniref:Uncharacterized protein n=1 Tax=Polyplax serrata TaxID=468196 RepID=A0AAN8SA00_POLSC